MLAKALASATEAAPKTYIEDVFSTWLYTGNGSTQTITNGIDLSGKGGLVWIKTRSSASNSVIYDTQRGIQRQLSSETTSAQVNTTIFGSGYGLTAFNSNGFTLGLSVNSENLNGATQASWTFRKAAKFFDVVTYTGDGNASKTISHNLGNTPGFLIVKRTDSTGQWQCYHRSLTSTNYYIQLNSTSAQQTLGSQVWAVSSTDFTVYGAATDTNINGATYVAYLFAHDAGGFGDSGNESVVSCGSYTADGSGNFSVALGWEPQLVIFRDSSAAANWEIIDNMRGFSLTDSRRLFPNLSNAEGGAGGPYLIPSSTGFQMVGSSSTPGATGIYIAIRRGPMKTPTDATKVFSTFARSGTGAAATITTPAFPVDFILGQERTAIGLNGGIAVDRLRGAAAYLRTPVTNAEGSSTAVVSALDSMTGFSLGASDALNGSSSTYANWNFRRAPGFFDVVAWTGNSNFTSRQIAHNLSAAPEMIIIKPRTLANGWDVYSANSSTTYVFNRLNQTLANFSVNVPRSSTASSVMIDVGYLSGSWNNVNEAGNTYIAYLFASCPGVSKVGNYTGTGTTQQINCGFTAGSRLVLIKRTDSTGDWFIWDTARGIISGNDSYLLLNSTAAEVTNTDYIDPYSAGFEISSTAPAAINANGGSFIYLAVA